MINRRIAKIKLRRGEYEEQKTKVFDSGELLYTTDKKKIYAGDGLTRGGVIISNKNFILNTPNLDIPSNASYGDILFNVVLGKTYILDKDINNNLIPTLIIDSDCVEYAKSEITKMLNDLRVLSSCL